MEREFVSGLPDKYPRPQRTLDDAIKDSQKAIIERRKRDERKRLYGAHMTPEIRKSIARMIGERDAE
jgi:hypothetical protein